jgi:hypothetical protein
VNNQTSTPTPENLPMKQPPHHTRLLSLNLLPNMTHPICSIRPLASSIAHLSAVLGLCLWGSSPAFAADGFWNVDANGNWVTAGDPPWLNSVVPGATSGTTNTHIATFGFTLTTSAQRTVTVDANRNIGGINFSATNGSTGTSSTNGGYLLSGGNLLLTNGGVIQTLAGTGAHQDRISSAIAIQATAARPPS